MSTNAPYFSINILDMHLGHKGRGNWEINSVFFLNYIHMLFKKKINSLDI